MANYEYIIASLPVLARSPKDGALPSWDGTLSFIRSQCTKDDSLLLDQLLRGFDEDSLGEAFYREAMGERPRKADVFAPEESRPMPPVNGFIKEWFTFDLRVRNEKVRYLNRALGRPEAQDIFLVPEGEFPELARVRAVLEGKDILEREKGLDELMWNKALEAVTFHNFDMDVVLSFVARLHIAKRWELLDPAKGEELFRRLVDEVRGTFKGVDFKSE